MGLFYEAEMNSVKLQVLVEDKNEMNAKIQWNICGLFLKRNFSQKSYAKTMSVKMEKKKMFAKLNISVLNVNGEKFAKNNENLFLAN